MKNKFLELLNSKLVIGMFIFVMLSLATVFAGDVIVKEGELIIEEGLEVEEKVRANDFILRDPLEEEVLSVINLTNFDYDEVILEEGQSMRESIALLIYVNQELLKRVEILESELCRLKKKKDDYVWCVDELIGEEVNSKNK